MGWWSERWGGGVRGGVVEWKVGWWSEGWGGGVEGGVGEWKVGWWKSLNHFMLLLKA